LNILSLRVAVGAGVALQMLMEMVVAEQAALERVLDSL
jgi:hypothetical protein